MDGFTRREADGDLLSPDSKARISTRKMRLDSKGRISLPAEIRRNFGLDSNSDIIIAFNLKKNFIFLLIGQDGVAESTEGCGSSGLGSNPGPDPGKIVRRVCGYGNNR